MHGSQNGQDSTVSVVRKAMLQPRPRLFELFLWSGPLVFSDPYAALFGRRRAERRTFHGHQRHLPGMQGTGTGQRPYAAKGIRTDVDGLVRHPGWNERHRAHRKPRLLIADGHFGGAFENEQDLLGAMDMLADSLVRLAHYVEDLGACTSLPRGERYR